MRTQKMVICLLVGLLPLRLSAEKAASWVDLTHDLSSESVFWPTAEPFSMTHNVPAFENVANLDRLPATGVYVIALPVKIRGGSGGPLRIIASIDDSE